MDKDFVELEPATGATSAVQLHAAGGETTIVDPAEHNVVFTSLVTSDQDIVGLVAYSIYKQNKYDWLQAFGRTLGRMPNDVEAQSYLLGESTPRRLATYRHLAEATLDGRGLNVPGSSSGTGSALTQRRQPVPATAARNGMGGFNRQMLVGGLVVVVLVIALVFFLHFGGLPQKT